MCEIESETKEEKIQEIGWRYRYTRGHANDGRRPACERKPWMSDDILTIGPSAWRSGPVRAHPRPPLCMGRATLAKGRASRRRACFLAHPSHRHASLEEWGATVTTNKLPSGNTKEPATEPEERGVMMLSDPAYRLPELPTSLRLAVARADAALGLRD